jgi:hypothetical protein
MLISTCSRQAAELQVPREQGELRYGVRQRQATKNGQRKLLALDGEGARGMLSIEILARIEQILRETHDDSSLPNTVGLFDYIRKTIAPRS